MALAAVEHPEPDRVRGALARAAGWVASMQCKTGGWAAFDVDNDKAWLNRIPYGDLKAMIDPGTADVTARVLEMVARCGLRDFGRGALRARARFLAARARARRRVVRALGRELRLRHERRAGGARPDAARRAAASTQRSCAAQSG